MYLIKLLNVAYTLFSDVSKKLREKDTEIINTQATVTRLQGRIHEMELTNKKNKLESDAAIKAMHHQQQRDKALVGSC